MYGSIEMIADTARESVDGERVNQVSDAISCPLSPPPILWNTIATFSQRYALRHLLGQHWRVGGLIDRLVYLEEARLLANSSSPGSLS